MHLLNPREGGSRKFTRAVLSYSVFHQLRQGVHSFDAGQWLVLGVLLMFDAFLGIVAVFSWAMFWPVAVVFTVPFVALTCAIYSRLRYGKP